MRVNLAGNRWVDIRFGRLDIVQKNGQWVKDDYATPGIKSVKTNCSISLVKDVTVHGRDNYVPISTGIAIRNPKDVPNKAKGFKIALAHAIKNSGDMFTLADRVVIWKVFLVIWGKKL